MSDENVVMETTDSKHRTWRVRLERDESPEAPYDDGSVPLWRVEHSGLGWRTEQVKMTSYDAVDVRLSDAVNRFNGPTVHKVERWLRAYHDVTIVEHWYSGNAWYIAADDGDWRKAMGVTPEQIVHEYERAGSLMSEYKAWVEGEVYGYVIERKRVAYTTVIEPADGEIIGTEKTEVWTEIDDVEGSMSGLFGQEYATEKAAEELRAYLYNLDKVENPWRYETITLVNPQPAGPGHPHSGITINKGEPVSPPKE